MSFKFLAQRSGWGRRLSKSRANQFSPWGDACRISVLWLSVLAGAESRAGPSSAPEFMLVLESALGGSCTLLDPWRQTTSRLKHAAGLERLGLRAPQRVSFRNVNQRVVSLGVQERITTLGAHACGMQLMHVARAQAWDAQLDAAPVFAKLNLADL
jgi:hypothetical protein